MPFACPHCGAKVKDGHIKMAVVYDTFLREENGDVLLGRVDKQIPEAEVDFQNMSRYSCEKCTLEFDSLTFVKD